MANFAVSTNNAMINTEQLSIINETHKTCDSMLTEGLINAAHNHVRSTGHLLPTRQPSQGMPSLFRNCLVDPYPSVSLHTI